MPPGFAPGLRPALNSVTTPAGVMRPIRLPVCSENQMLPSGPRAIPRGDGAGGMPALNSVMSCACAGAATSCNATSVATAAHAATARTFMMAAPHAKRTARYGRANWGA